MKKRSLLMAASLVLALLVATTGTLAYLSDVDSDVNVMTLGNVKIDQFEMQRANPKVHTGLAKDGDLVPFVDGQPLYPAYPVTGKDLPYTAEPTELFYWGPYVTAESDGTNGANGAGNGLWNPDKLVGAMDKIVFVKNTGSSPAYYRTWIAFECPEGMEYSQGSDKEFMMNINRNSRFEWENIGYEVIEGTRYLIMCATYQNELAPGEISRPSLLQVVMTHNATNEDMALLGGTYEILAYTQAVQTTNFENAEQALTAAFGEATLANIPWLTDATGLPVTPVATADELAAALANGGTIVLTADIELTTEQLTVAEDTTLVLGGYDITATPGEMTSTYGLFNIPAGKTMTVEGEGEVKLIANVTKGISAAIFQNDGDLIINGGTYEANQANSVAGLGAMIGVIDNCPGNNTASVTINGGEFTVTGQGAINVIRSWPIGAGANTYLTINGGTFSKNPDRTTYIWSKNDTASKKEPIGHSYVTINGGTFDDIKLEIDGFQADHFVDSSVTGVEIVEGSICGYLD